MRPKTAAGLVALCLLPSVAFVSLASFHERVARADTPVRARSPQEEAQTAMELGVAATTRGDHASALEQYRRAQALVPEANLPHRFAAEALERLGRYEEAIASYEAYLLVRANVRDAEKVRARIAEIRAQHVEGVLDVVSNPSGSAVFLDEQAASLGDTPLRDVRVRAGAHKVRVRFLGYRETVLETHVIAGSKVVLQCELERVPETAGLGVTAAPVAPASSLAAATRPGTSPPEAERGTAWYGRWWIWAGAGTAVAAGVIATVLLTSTSDPPATQGGTHRFPEGS